MRTFETPEYRITPAQATGMGWVHVERWDPDVGQYRHVSAFRSEKLAQDFIDSQISKGEENGDLH
jgi:hypothetical protein